MCRNGTQNFVRKMSKEAGNGSASDEWCFKLEKAITENYR
jgi:hypothetical protein